MTTMDSDSESQDSDEGRRFRFEATRKDAHITQSAARRRKPSPFQPNRRPSREKSRERTRHDRSRSHDKDRRKDRDRHSRDRHGRSGSSSKEPVRSAKNSKEDRARKDREDRHRDHNPKSLHKDYDRRDSRSKDFKRDRRRSRDSYDRRTDKRDRSRRYSKERDRHKKSRDNERVAETNTGNGDKNSTHDGNDRISNLSDNQDCKDLNLSDFDIVSDTEGNSQSDSSLRGRNWSRDSRDRKSRLRSRSRSKSKSKSRSRGKSRGSKSRSGSRSRSKLKASPVEIVGDEILNVIDSIGNDNEEEEEEEDDDELEKFNTDILLHASTSAPSLDSVNDNDNLKICTDLIDNLSDDDDNKNYSNLNIDDIDEENHGEVEVDSGNCYGPTLPPKSVGNSKSVVESKNSEVKIIGPCLPEGFKKVAQDEDETFGPSLPPTLQRVGDEKKLIGPSLPRHLMEHLDDEDDYLMEVDVEGEPDELDEEEEILGPLPADHPTIGSDRIQRQLEYRARLIKEELAQIDYREEKKREEWMTELPAVRSANLGLGPRKFRTKEGPDFSDRSTWTDTPVDRERKQKELKMGKRPAEAIDDSPREKSSKRHEKSLMEMHQKKLNKKRRKDEKEAKKNQTTVRRPFDREIDMQVNRFDDARKKSILMSAQRLDDRFSRGKM